MTQRKSRAKPPVAEAIVDALCRQNTGAREASSLGMSAEKIAYYATRWPHGIGKTAP